MVVVGVLVARLNVLKLLNPIDTIMMAIELKEVQSTLMAAIVTIAICRARSDNSNTNKTNILY